MLSPHYPYCTLTEASGDRVEKYGGIGGGGSFDHVMRTIAGLALLFVLVPRESIVLAEPEGPTGKRFDVGGYFGLQAYSNNTKLGHQGVSGLRSAPIFGPRATYWLSSRFAVEASVTMSNTATNDNIASVFIVTPEVQIAFNPLPGRLLYPNLLAGTGLAMSFSNRGNTYANSVAPVGFLGGGGAFERLGWMGFRLDARVALYEGRNDTVISPEFQVMFSAYKIFNRSKTKPARVVPQPPPSAPENDPDRDAVLSKSDQCPNDPEDRDGLADSDGCPEIDADSDYVIDEFDLCQDRKENLNGFKDEDGCPDELPDVFQNLGKIGDRIRLKKNGTLRVKDVNALAPIVDALKKNPSVRLVVIGFADGGKDSEANQDRASKTAKEVAWVLTHQGVPEFQVLPIGLTPTTPSAQVAGVVQTTGTSQDVELRVWVRKP